MKKFVLIGDDIEKSLSPQLHQMFFTFCNIDAEYKLFQCDKLNKKIIDNLKTHDGFNITKPFKLELAQNFNSQLDSINTVKKDGDNYTTYSTDGEAITLLLKNRKLDICNKRLLIIGGGGAAIAVAKELSKFTLNIEIFNRTFPKAEHIAKQYNLTATVNPSGKYFGILSFVNTDKLLIDEDIVSNATFVLDSYYFKVSKLMQLATSVQAIDGLEMLFYQAYLSEKIWNNIELSRPILDMLLNKFKNLRELV